MEAMKSGLEKYLTQLNVLLQKKMRLSPFLELKLVNSINLSDRIDFGKIGSSKSSTKIEVDDEDKKDAPPA